MALVERERGRDQVYQPDAYHRRVVDEEPEAIWPDDPLRERWANTLALAVMAALPKGCGVLYGPPITDLGGCNLKIEFAPQSSMAIVVHLDVELWWLPKDEADAAALRNTLEVYALSRVPHVGEG